MLYLITFGIIFIWTVILLRKRQLSWHSIVTAYVIGVLCADIFEGLFNLILGLYKFPTHLSTNPIYENEFGIIFSDFLILPFTLIIFVHYAAKTKHPWRVTIPFAIGFIILELIFLKFGYLEYRKWNIIYSSFFFLAGFRFGAFLAPLITNYDPPIYYRVRLFCFSHMILMWTSAIFAMPLLKMYQFRPGWFQDFMTDCRVGELVTGDILALLIMIFIPAIPTKLKPLVFTCVTFIGVSIALISYQKGWLIYHNWNHFLTTLRYAASIALIMLFDHWESTYNVEKAQ